MQKRCDIRLNDLKEKLRQWKEDVRKYKEQLNDGIISEDEYIKLINDAEKIISSQAMRFTKKDL